MSKIDTATIFIAGYSKSGSTSLFNAIKAHPQVYKPKLKFLCFLSPRKHLRNKHLPHISDGIDSFHECFELEEKQDAHHYVDATESYIQCKSSLDLIPRYFSNYKILLIARNPLKREISSFFYGVNTLKLLRHGGLNSYLRKQSRNKQKADGGLLPKSPYYSISIAQLLEIVPKENVCFIEMEHWVKDLKVNQAHVAGLCGLDPEFYNDFILERSNKGVKPTLGINMNQIVSLMRSATAITPIFRPLLQLAQALRHFEKKVKPSIDYNKIIRKLPQDLFDIYLDICRTEKRYLDRTFGMDISWPNELEKIRNP